MITPNQWIWLLNLSGISLLNGRLEAPLLAKSRRIIEIGAERSAADMLNDIGDIDVNILKKYQREIDIFTKIFVANDKFSYLAHTIEQMLTPDHALVVAINGDFLHYRATGNLTADRQKHLSKSNREKYVNLLDEYSYQWHASMPYAFNLVNAISLIKVCILKNYVSIEQQIDYFERIYAIVTSTYQHYYQFGVSVCLANKLFEIIYSDYYDKSFSNHLLDNSLTIVSYGLWQYIPWNGRRSANRCWMCDFPTSQTDSKCPNCGAFNDRQRTV